MCASVCAGKGIAINGLRVSGEGVALACESLSQVGGAHAVCGCVFLGLKRLLRRAYKAYTRYTAY